MTAAPAPRTGRAAAAGTSATARSAPTMPEHAIFGALRAAVDASCARVAPAWPLDRMIAVNPFWGFIGSPMKTAAAHVASLHGARLTMPLEWYHARWSAGAFSEHDFQLALGDDAWSQLPTGGIGQLLTAPAVRISRIALMTDVADAARVEPHRPTWNEFAVDHISRCCAAHFDEGQARWKQEGQDGLFASWQYLAARDHAPRIVMGHRNFRIGAAALPNEPWQLIAEALAELQVAEGEWATYCTALLMSVNGWAATSAFRRWSAALEGRGDDTIVELLAVRMAWELLLLRGAAPSISAGWAAAKAGWSAAFTHHARDHQSWNLQRAIEYAYQLPLARQLSLAVRAVASPAGSPAHTAPVPPLQSQLAFCIDVRSEPFRRALEVVAPRVQTLGFAGFFGAPIAYRSVAGVTRPQLPGLLASRLLVDDVGDDSAIASAREELNNPMLRVTTLLTSLAVTGFPFVEMSGIVVAPTLLRSALGTSSKTVDPARAGADGRLQSQLKPRITGDIEGNGIDAEARAGLAANMLRGMSLVDNFAPLLVLVGHTSHSCNNPQSASLSCGACGGQSGEVNARVMAAVLNEPDVRRALRGHGIDVPSTTHVAAAVHNTTTDNVTLYDGDDVPGSHAEHWVMLEQQLQQAGDAARRGRAPLLRITASTPAALQTAFRTRATNWSEVRPEWGLARNASFIVAPRARTAGIDLQGRAFLHDYNHAADLGYAVLEAIMTAPMLVTHWINMQYYASTVDNLRYGSGDKTLHNVVGASLGVLEGASGDLRTGLALQSLHDGDTWYHEPLRLSVFIEAPAAAIDSVIQQHDVVRHLVDGEWLHLFRIDTVTGVVSQRTDNGWALTADAAC